MKLEMRLNGDINPLINYFKRFEELGKSLLLEIDVAERAFVAKSAGEDKGYIFFSALPFKDCGVSVISSDEDIKEINQKGIRVKMGILHQLSRLIKILTKMASNKDDKGLSDFTFTFNYDGLTQPDNTVQFACTNAYFKIPGLKMKMDAFRLKEFKNITDAAFNNVISSVIDPLVFNISSDMIDNIIDTSKIFSIDPKNDRIIFTVDGTDVIVKDYIDLKPEPNFSMQIATIEKPMEYEVNAMIRRDRFCKFLEKNKADDEYIITIGRKEVRGTMMMHSVIISSCNSLNKMVIALEGKI